MKTKLICIGMVSMFLLTSLTFLSALGKVTATLDEIVVPDDLKDKMKIHQVEKETNPSEILTLRENE